MGVIESETFRIAKEIFYYPIRINGIIFQYNGILFNFRTKALKIRKKEISSYHSIVTEIVRVPTNYVSLNLWPLGLILLSVNSCESSYIRWF
ncbi:hypothetical protein [Leptospira santarosai]|nr:hypothetical protein [Leptospira santarosai]ASV11570.1 hypothetical protein B2G51_07260 [Leptospira santarosai]EMO15870.1 hypothetical protein LEP1GSC165_1420 [Leptospira santarosai str. CBC523]MDI7166201.1 hypothetical protein [Leptospira santarosai]MDO6383971.1 hypothetical protein [Leptospira santarosai]MDO6393166.1 hypothetical protein [Leptospira santarosai]